MGLEAARAEAVDRFRRRPCAAGPKEHDVARQIEALLGLRHGAAEHDVLDVLGFQALHAGDGFEHDRGAQIVRAGAPQGALQGTTYEECERGDDGGIEGKAMVYPNARGGFR